MHSKVPPIQNNVLLLNMTVKYTRVNKNIAYITDQDFVCKSYVKQQTYLTLLKSRLNPPRPKSHDWGTLVDMDYLITIELLE